MASKRKAPFQASQIPKKITKCEDHTMNLVYEEPYSDPDYSSSGELSDEVESHKDTPTTPFSTSSSKYPSDLKTRLCPFEGCTKAFNRPARLQEHLRSHNNERIFRCAYDNCEKTFLRTSHLNHHIKSAHTTVRDYVCDRPGCGKTFVTGSRLRRHLAAHDGRDKYRCTEYPPCNEAFRKHSTLHKHVAIMHLNQKPFSCPHVDAVTREKCAQAFDTANRLRAHKGRVHTANRFSCAECSHEIGDDASNSQGPMSIQVSFSTYAQLQAHIKSRHPPKCPSCPIICSTSRELRRHLELAHSDVNLEDRRIFPCIISGCDRSFTKKGNLAVHVRTVHDGEKRFVCGETDLTSSKNVEGWSGEGCGKQYGSKLALEQHVRTGHLGLQNAKAKRKERQGLHKLKERIKPPVPSALATLTGEGYAEETGRRVSCFIEGCQYRFHRDYDLWVHLSSKHQCSEDEIQDLYTQRELLAYQKADNPRLFGLGCGYGDMNERLIHPDDTIELIHADDDFNENLINMDSNSGLRERADAAMLSLCPPGDQGPAEPMAIDDTGMIDPRLTHMMEE